MSKATNCLRSFFGLNFTFIQKASSFSDGLVVAKEIFRDYVMSVLQRSSSGPSNDEDDEDGDQKR